MLRNDAEGIHVGNLVSQTKLAEACKPGRTQEDKCNLTSKGSKVTVLHQLEQAIRPMLLGLSLVVGRVDTCSKSVLVLLIQLACLPAPSSNLRSSEARSRRRSAVETRELDTADKLPPEPLLPNGTKRSRSAPAEVLPEMSTTWEAKDHRDAPPEVQVEGIWAS